MDGFKILLIQPPIQDFYLTKKRTIPYGLASIASAIRNEGFDVNIIDALATKKSKPIPYPASFEYLTDFYEQKDISQFSLFHDFKHFGYSHEHIGNLVRKEKPFIVGISSLFTAYADQALETAATIKKFYPNCQIVMGGHHPTVFPKQVLSHDCIDYVIRGEGEVALPQLCTVLKKSGSLNKNTKTFFNSLSQIEGLCYRTDQGLHLSDPTWINDLSKLPTPAVDLIDPAFYQRNKKRAVSILTSRGCPMPCSYCSVSSTSSHGRFRQRPVEDIIKEIDAQSKLGDIGFIDFEDENLSLNKKWFTCLFKGLHPLLKGKDIELRAMNGLFPPSLDNDVITLMKKAGFKTLNLSLGTTNKQQLKQFKRPDIFSSFETAVDLATDHGLETVSYIIAGAPGQSANSSLADLLYLAQKRTLIGLSVYYPAPGSLDYSKQSASNLLPTDQRLMRSSTLPFDNTTSRLETITLLRLSRVINFIKQCIDDAQDLPDPENFNDEPVQLPINRKEVTIKLLGSFLYDGIIRGVTPDGSVYEQRCDTGLTQTFLKKIKGVPIQGIKSQDHAVLL